jgi:short-subunit dehydrogenase
MEGMGSDGRKHSGLAYYGMTKYGLSYFTDCLVDDTKGTPLIVGALRPGMVITDMIYEQYKERPEEFQDAQRIFNIIADTVDNVSPWLATRILNNKKSGVRISYMSRTKMIGRFLTAPFTKRDLFAHYDAS